MRNFFIPQPDLTRDEFATEWKRRDGGAGEQRHHRSCTPPMRLHALKKSRYPTERERSDVQKQREEFAAKLKQLDARRVVAIDEAGSTIDMTRDRAWCRSGARGTVLTMLGALTVDGLETVMTNIGATTGDVFFRFVRDHLVAVLQKGDVVLMDRLAAHFRSDAVALIREAGADVLYVLPYSPDYNPIELAWSKLKNSLRKLGARTVARLKKAIEDTMLDIHRATRRIGSPTADIGLNPHDPRCQASRGEGARVPVACVDNGRAELGSRVPVACVDNGPRRSGARVPVACIDSEGAEAALELLSPVLTVRGPKRRSSSCRLC
jgi:transposase